jgi:hypothetical protein
MRKVMNQEMLELEIRFRQEFLAACGAIASGGLRPAAGAGSWICRFGWLFQSVLLLFSDFCICNASAPVE